MPLSYTLRIYFWPKLGKLQKPAGRCLLPRTEVADRPWVVGLWLKVVWNPPLLMTFCFEVSTKGLEMYL